MIVLSMMQMYLAIQTLLTHLFTKRKKKMYYLMRKNPATLKYETDLAVYGMTEEDVIKKVEEETNNVCYLDLEGDIDAVNVPYKIFREFRPLNDTDTPYGLIYSIG